MLFYSQTDSPCSDRQFMKAGAHPSSRWKTSCVDREMEKSPGSLNTITSLPRTILRLYEMQSSSSVLDSGKKGSCFEAHTYCASLENGLQARRP